MEKVETLDLLSELGKQVSDGQVETLDLLSELGKQLTDGQVQESGDGGHEFCVGEYDETSSAKEAQPSGTRKRKPSEKTATEETISEKKAQPSVSEKKNQRETVAGNDDDTFSSMKCKLWTDCRINSKFVNSPRMASLNRMFKDAALLAVFCPRAALPTKANVITIYRKYGELDEDRTCICYNFAAWIVFRNGTDAELAYKDSVANNPFPGANVHFSVHSVLAGKVHGGHHIPRESWEALLLHGGEEPDIVAVKRKLEAMCLMLEGKEGKVSAAMKLALRKEMESLLTGL